MAWDRETTQKLWLALGISVCVHIAIAVVGEVSTHDRAAKVTPPPPVEISRVAMDGSPLPEGRGNSAFNSVASSARPAAQPTYQGLEAGVPVRLPDPPKTNPVNRPTEQVPYVPPVTQSQPQTQPFQPPVQAQPQGGQQTQPQVQQPSQTQPQSNPVSSAPSNSSTAGNAGQKRSRGPNRAAFPLQTFEPNVPGTLMTGGVTNAVEVSVDIAADGSHTERIVKTSGSSEVDGLVLDALKTWKWDPAAQNNVAIPSSQSFRFTFKPRG